VALNPGAGPTGASPEARGIDLPDLRLFVFALFFIFGGITSLNDILIPKLKGLFTLSYFEAMLVQSAFFAAYFVVSLPAAAIVQRIGYMRTASVGLLVMMAGCLLFIPASLTGSFAPFLAALFVLAAGVTTVQVVANPLISLLGPPATAHSRLTFAQAFNSLGTTLFPWAGATLILGSIATIGHDASPREVAAHNAQETRVIWETYLGLALALAAIAAMVWWRRNRLPHAPEVTPILSAFNLLSQQRFAMGTLGIFLYVGAEVAIGSLIVNYLMQTDVLGLPEQQAGHLVAFYWGGALVGRFIGAAILRVVLVSGLSSGVMSGYALLAVGLANSIMFPTIFTLASEDLGTRQAEGSGLICMAIVGGAIIPPLTGLFADAAGLRTSLLLPAACYLYIALFGIWAVASRRRAVHA
jgi:FHS family L-fucose permease-like MFS transporter